MKIIIPSIKLFITLKKLPLINRYVMFDPNLYEQIANPADHSYAMRDIFTNDSPTKHTSSKRFDDVNNELLKILEGSDDELYVHDLSVSNGVTSIELMNALTENKIKIRMYISDKYNTLKFTKINKFLTLYFDQYNNYYGARILSSIFYTGRRFTSAYDLTDKSINTINILFGGVIKLIKSKKVKFLVYDIFESELKIKFDIVRCMNILNICFFTDDQIIKGIQNIKLSIKENGLFVVGRTDINGNNSTFYKMIEGELIAIKSIGLGTEIDELIATANRIDTFRLTQ